MHSTVRNALALFVLPALASILAVAIAADGKLQILSFGQSATRIDTPAGKVIVIDPFLTKNPKTPTEYKNLDKIDDL